MKKLIVLNLAFALLTGCAFLIEPVDTGSHQWWDQTRKGW